MAAEPNNNPFGWNQFETLPNGTKRRVNGRNIPAANPANAANAANPVAANNTSPLNKIKEAKGKVEHHSEAARRSAEQAAKAAKDVNIILKKYTPKKSWFGKKKGGSRKMRKTRKSKKSRKSRRV